MSAPDAILDAVLAGLPEEDRLVAWVEEACAFGVRRPGSAAGHEVERWVAEEMCAAGLDVRLSRIDVPTWEHGVGWLTGAIAVDAVDLVTLPTEWMRAIASPVHDPGAVPDHLLPFGTELGREVDDAISAGATGYVGVAPCRGCRPRRTGRRERTARRPAARIVAATAGRTAAEARAAVVDPPPPS